MYLTPFSVINMLHPIISNGICSLNPNVDRLTRTMEMEITPMGEIADYKIYDSVIRSRKAMSYSKCNEVFAGKIVSDYEEYRFDLMNMLKLYNILEAARQKRNFLNFRLLEVKEKSDEYNKIHGFDNKESVFVGTETRTSSPIRIIRDENLESNIKGIYPAGEGAGYAGGITSAAVDGIKVFEAIASKYRSNYEEN